MSATLDRERRRIARTGAVASRSHPSVVASRSQRFAQNRYVHWLPMSDDARSPRSARENKHGTITQFITIIALGALMLLGFVALSHSDNGPASGVVATASDAASQEPAASVVTSAVQASAYDASPGMALCVLGVVCGFVLYLVIHLLVRRGRVGLTLLRALPPSLIHAVVIRSGGHALTIAQLGISRT